MPKDTSYSAYDLEVLSLLRHATCEERRDLATLMAHNFPAPVDENEQNPEKLLAGLHKKGDGDYGRILRDIAKKIGINCMQNSATQTQTMFPAAMLEKEILTCLLKRLKEKGLLTYLLETLKEKDPQKYAQLEKDIDREAEQLGAELLGAILLYGDAAVNACIAAGGVAARVVAESLLSRIALPAIANPVGWACVAGLTAYQVYDLLAAPAFKVTVPAVMQIYRLRGRIACPAVTPVSPLADI